MILERFELPENQKKHEKLKNSKLAQKTSRYEGRSAESKTLSLFKMFFKVLRFLKKKDGQKPLGGCRERHKTICITSNFCFWMKYFCLCIVGRLYMYNYVFFNDLRRFFLWCSEILLLDCSGQLLLFWSYSCSCYYWSTAGYSCWWAATLSAAQPGSRCGLVWSGSLMLFCFYSFCCSMCCLGLLVWRQLWVPLCCWSRLLLWVLLWLLLWMWLV